MGRSRSRSRGRSGSRGFSRSRDRDRRNRKRSRSRGRDRERDRGGRDSRDAGRDYYRPHRSRSPSDSRARRMPKQEDDDDEEEEEEDGGLTTPTESTTTAPAAEARDVQDMQRVKVEGGPGEGEVVTAQDEAGAAVTGRSPSPHAAPLETAAVQPEAPSRLAFRKVEIQEEDDDEDEEEGGEDGAVETAKEAAPPTVSQEDLAAESDRLKEAGNEAMKRGDAAGAVRLYTESLSKNARNILSLNNRSLAHLKLEKWDAAEADASDVLRQEPLNVKALFRRGKARRCRAAKLEPKDAAKLLEAALEDLHRCNSIEPSNKQSRQEAEAASKLLASVKASLAARAAAPRPGLGGRVATAEPLEVLQAQRAAEEQEEASAMARGLSSAKPGGPLIQEVCSRPRTTRAVPAEKEEERRTSPTPTKATPPPPAPSSARTTGQQQQHRISPIPTPTTRAGTCTSPSSSAVPSKAATTLRLVSKPKVPKNPPKSMYELETTWRNLKTDLGLFAHYLKTFTSATFEKVFKESTNPEVTTDVFRAADEHLSGSDPAAALVVMDSMTRVGHFDMMMMMASAEDRQRIKRTLQKIEDAQGREAVAPLRRAYGC